MILAFCFELANLYVGILTVQNWVLRRWFRIATLSVKRTHISRCLLANLYMRWTLFTCQYLVKCVQEKLS